MIPFEDLVVCPLNCAPVARTDAEEEAGRTV